jgi:hypothetical protein
MDGILMVFAVRVYQGFRMKGREGARERLTRCRFGDDRVLAALYTSLLPAP